MTALRFSNPAHAPADRNLHFVEFDRRENACHSYAIEAAMLKWPKPAQEAGLVAESAAAVIQPAKGVSA
jgi:hypothetical protein